MAYFHGTLDLGQDSGPDDGAATSEELAIENAFGGEDGGGAPE